MGTSWRAGELVLKPADAGPDELDWQAEIYGRLLCRGFRVGAPRRAADGSVCAGGWSATEFVPGRHEAGRWPEIIDVGERFHAALRAVPRPGFLDRRSNLWAVSDRVAWGEAPPGTVPETRYLAQLTAAVRPVSAASQLVHGDLTGNVLFHDQLPPPRSSTWPRTGGPRPMPRRSWSPTRCSSKARTARSWGRPGTSTTSASTWSARSFSALPATGSSSRISRRMSSGRPWSTWPARARCGRRIIRLTYYSL